MSVNQLGRILCLWNTYAESCCREAESLVERLKAAGADVVTSADRFDATIELLVLLGGDGFLMESLQELDYPDVPVFGVNFGSVGFLMNRKACLPQLVDTIKDGLSVEESHPILQATVELDGGEQKSICAFNDFFLERMTRQSVRLLVALDGVEFNHYAGDGFVFCSAAGSTAYNLAAGGPVLQPGLEAIIMTPLYPHRAVPFSSMQFPLVVPLSASIEIRASEPVKRPMRLVADGHAIESVVRVGIGFSGKRARLLRLPGHTFVTTLTRKIIGET